MLAPKKNTLPCVFLPIILLVLFVASGCTSQAPDTTPQAVPSLAGTAWVVTEMIDQTTGSEMAKDVDPQFMLTVQFNEDGSVSGSTPLNTLEGRWSTESSTISISLNDRTVSEVDDSQTYLLMTDFSIGTALVEARKFLLSSDGRTLSLFDSDGRMVLRATSQQ